VLHFNPASPTGYTRLSGTIKDIVIDGSAAGNGAIGLQLQDMNGAEYRVAARNFTGTNAAGFQLANNTHSMNNIKGYFRSENNSNGMNFTTLGPENAIEHIYISVAMDAHGNLQNGFVLSNSVGLQGCRIEADIGFAPASGTAFVFAASTNFQDTDFVFKCECTGPATTATSASFTGAGSGFQRTTGTLHFDANLLVSNAVAANVQVNHFGAITGDANMILQADPPANTGTYDQASVVTPAFPASGTPVTNNSGNPVGVNVAGGTLSAATQINAVNVGDINQRFYFLPRGQTIKLTYSAAPTGWLWQPVG
jgi:hypothetical protein